MLDELLGRAALKDRIAELEDELERAEAQLDAERDRRREAVRDRQTADERVNRLEDRIADLEGQLDRAESGDQTLRFRGTTTLRGDRLEEVLTRLSTYQTGPEGALTAMVADRSGTVPDAFGDRTALVRRAAPCIALTDDTGIVCIAVTPPLPPDPFIDWATEFQIEREWFRPTGEFAFALVRSDVFAYGEYSGPDRQYIDGFESDVTQQHSKGGFSQARFERRRDEQIETHVQRCTQVLDDRNPDRLIVVGERTLLGEFEAATHTAPVDATGSPEAALDAAFSDFWTTTLYAL